MHTKWEKKEKEDGFTILDKADPTIRIRVKSFIWKRGAFGKEDQSLHVGDPTYCTHVKGKLFHLLYLDCDNRPLRTIQNGIEILRQEFPELAKEKFFIINSSSNHFSLASFVRLSWSRCLDIMWRSIELGIEHQGHAYYSKRKGYAVLRTGAKDGIVPRILYSIGDTITCKKCFKEFAEGIEMNEAT